MDLLVAELVCHSCRVPDMIALFKTCRELHSLSKRISLWSTLLRRDFPIHADVVPPGSQRTWFQDLYQYGAFFGIDTRIHLFPSKCVYFAQFCNRFVMTSRKDEGFLNGRVWARKVGVNYVGIADRRQVKRNAEALETFEQLLKTNPTEHSEFELDYDRHFFTRMRNDMNCCLANLLKYDASPWDELEEWLHEHFEIEKIVVDDCTCDFKGRLLKGNIVGSVDPSFSPRDMEQISDAMCLTTLIYSISADRDSGWKAEMFCREIDATFITMNDEPIPFRELEEADI
jgi:hypothetical protein